MVCGSVAKNPPANTGDVGHWRAQSLRQGDPWRRKWPPAPAFLPGESHGQRSLAGYGPWGLEESDTTEQLSMHAHIPDIKQITNKDLLYRTGNSIQCSVII